MQVHITQVYYVHTYFTAQLFKGKILKEYFDILYC